MADRLHNFSFVWKDLVAGSAHPGFGQELAANLATMREAGIHAVLSLTEDPLEQPTLSEFEMDYLHEPIDDFSAPEQKQIQEAVRFIGKHAEQGEGTLVHCRAGLGRTGTILACYLVSQGLDPAEAIRQVRRQRPGSLEVYSQEYSVYEFSRQTERSE